MYIGTHTYINIHTFIYCVSVLYMLQYISYVYIQLLYTEQCAYKYTSKDTYTYRHSCWERKKERSYSPYTFDKTICKKDFRIQNSIHSLYMCDECSTEKNLIFIIFTAF